MAATATRETVDFPLNSFRDAAAQLRRPFTPQAVKFKVQATWPKDNPTGGLVVAYIDARLAVERLNLIVPHLWHDEYAQIDKNHMLCKLTVDGITRQDIGEGSDKGLFSDALKRAAVKFGIGVSLYAIPKMMISVEAGEAKQRRTKDGLTLEMTPKGEGKVRAIYEQWLKAHGAQAFGEALDHGDLDGAQGDAEVDSPPVPDVVVQPFGRPYDKARSKDLETACKALCDGKPDIAKLLVKVVMEDCGGYLPEAAAIALIRAANAELLFPEVKAPEL